jgi:predicted esterase
VYTFTLPNFFLKTAPKMKKLYIPLIVLLTISFSVGGYAQSVLDPSDPVITYNPNNPPAQPNYGQIGKWVRTVRVGWNSDSYKAYIYKGSAFRLKFPKTYNPTANDGKKYPMMVFFHGAGESGTIYDNEYQLYHGGNVFKDAVDNGTFDGYILCMQSTEFYWDTHQYQNIAEIIDYMITHNKLDPFQVSVNGLSAGGEATWGMLIEHPTYISAALPMSSSSTAYETSSIANDIKFTPLWLFQGGLDGSPAPYTSQQVRDYMLNAGANFSYKEYPTLGHGTWDSVWKEPDFWPYQLRAYASNPWTLHGRTEFCAGDAINVTIGVTPGFDEYQWEKNGVPMSATGNTINVQDTGTYSCRVRRGSVWSDWSHTPAHIKIKAPTITPPINVSGMMSTAIPAADGKNYVNLEVPDNGYTSYTWKKVGSGTVIGTDRILKVMQPGDYIVAVTEQYGCSSVYSPSFHVIDATGANAPDAAKGLTAITLSKTEIELDWANNPRPNYNETAFEIYRSQTSGSSYVLIGKVHADSLTYIDNGLTPNVKYYYVVRAINNNGAAPLSNETNATTQSDETAPTAPRRLTVKSTSGTSVSLEWDSSTDNVGVASYEIYINGVKSYSTTQTSFNVTGLAAKQEYSFYVIAKDFSGNYSARSNQINAATILQGLRYKYYEGLWSALPDFNKLPLVKTGISPNIDITVRNRNDQFGFLWEGYLYVPVAGTYKFETYSDEGSNVWLSTYNASSAPLVNNDGIHTMQFASGTITLQPGAYPISIAYFDRNGGQGIKLYWTCTQLFGDNNRHIIADEYFKDSYTAGGTAPEAPSKLTVKTIAYNKIRINWADNSNNETGFEIYRSTDVNNGYTTVYTSHPNETHFIDSTLSPSTIYYYRMIAINNYGASKFTSKKSDTTFALPVAPKAPTNLKAISQSASQISLSWVDKATNEVGYSVLRSIGDTNHFKQLATLPANSNAYTDSSLFAHITYYYKVIATRVGGSTSSSNITSATTSNNLPIITDITDRSVPYGITTVISVTATDIDGDSLSYHINGRPSFASFASKPNNTGILTLNPTSSDQGSYNIQIIADDNNGGKDTTTFTLTVNNNYSPVIDAISNYTLDEDDNININLTAHDQNAADVLTWSVNNAPNAFTLTPGANGTATLNLHPSFAAAGIYKVQVTVSDGKGGSDTKQFTVTVNDKNPNTTIYARFMANDTIGAPWNSITGTTTNNLKDASNNATGVNITLQTGWWSAYNGGSETGNNSGVYPDAVLKDYYYFGIFGGPDSVAVKISGLNTEFKYNLTFFANSIFSNADVIDNGNTTYTVNGTTVSLYVQNNTQNTVTIYNVTPDATGSIIFKMGKAANAQIGYINALVINSVYDDGTAPLTPQLSSAQNQSNGVKLTWQDLAYNESSYKIFRSTSVSGTYTQIDTTAANVSTYFDSTVHGNTQYYYKLRASNAYGNSDYSNVVGVYVANEAPIIAKINNIVLRNDQQLTVNVTAQDDPSDNIILKATQLPPFVTFKDNGDGTGYFSIQPTVGTTGYYSGITLTATDNGDSSSSQSFDITVTDALTTAVYLNFSDQSLPAGKPWNNLSNWPASGVTYNNIVDQNNNQTGMGVTLVNGFQGEIIYGMRPGNGRTIYPETVLRTGVYESTTTTRTIKITGLSTAKRYNFVFFNSHQDGYNCLTNFTINGQTVSLDASYNIDKTVEINNITPDASGQVSISVAKASSATYAFLSAMVIESYDPSVTILPPGGLRIIDTKRNSVTLQWADRSYNETGFQIWRADDNNNTYSLIKTLPANTVTYKDSSLDANKAYYYVVKAITGGTSSNASNVVAAHTLAYEVYINLTSANDAPSLWNNTDLPPEDGTVFSNLHDDTYNITSITGTVNGFTDDYTVGMNTGNNSGIYPDAVFAESYAVFPGQTGILKISGLNINQKYNFTFSASLQTFQTLLTTAYTVNGKTVIFDPLLNTKGAVTMYDIVPDENGEVNIYLTTVSSSMQVALFGSLIIQGYDPSTQAVPAPPALKANPIASGSTENIKTQVTQQNINGVQIKAYPNPFINNYQLSVTADKDEDVAVEMYNMAGKLVYLKKFSNLYKGENTLNVQPNITTPGVYIVKIIFNDEKLVKVVKIIKQ